MYGLVHLLVYVNFFILRLAWNYNYYTHYLDTIGKVY